MDMLGLEPVSDFQFSAYFGKPGTDSGTLGAEQMFRKTGIKFVTRDIGRESLLLPGFDSDSIC